MTLYKARVVSNSDFAKNGKIKVRIFKNTMPDLWRPLNEIPDSIKEANQVIKSNGGFYIKSSEDEAYVASMFGGGFDYGVFSLPQPNSIGIVATIESEGGGIEYVWLGTASFKQNGRISIPSNSEKDVNGVTNGANLAGEEGLVIKTKDTNYIGSKNVKPNELDFSMKGFTNLIAINSNGVEIFHRRISSNDDGTINIYGTSKVLINSNGISGEFYPYKDNYPDAETYSKFNINSNGEIALERAKKDQATCTLNTGSEVDVIENKELGYIKLSVNGKDSSSNFKMREDIVEVESDGNMLQLIAKNSKNKDNGGIRITASDNAEISLVGGRVNLGSAGKSVVLVDNAFADAMGSAGFTGDGVTFFASGTIKG